MEVGGRRGGEEGQQKGKDSYHAICSFTCSEADVCAFFDACFMAPTLNCRVKRCGRKRVEEGWMDESRGRAGWRGRRGEKLG